MKPDQKQFNSDVDRAGTVKRGSGVFVEPTRR